MPEPNINSGKWEKRWHPLRQEWVVYAAHRNSRPWSGASVKSSAAAPAYDANCYLCPGNKRIHNEINPTYKDVFVFNNDHPVVGKNSPLIPESLKYNHDHLYVREQAIGISKVVCYDPRHNLTLSEITLERVTNVFLSWREEMKGFHKDPEIKFVLIFENKGEAVGVSNPHPHCQIYATDFIFNLVERELKACEEYKKDKDRNIFEDIIKAEQKDKIRIIAENENAIAFIPFFARYAYEVMVFPKKRHATLISMSDSELKDMADVFQQVIRRYDLNFKMSFPYVMSFFQAPVDGEEYPDYHLHMLLQPPLRQPGLVKFLAGPEIGAGNFMADTVPEEKAAELKKVNLSEFIEII